MTTTVDVKIDRRFRLLFVLSGATFLIFFQAFMVAPLIPRLSDIFGVPVETIGLIVPAYLIPYGMTTLIYGPLSDRLGRRPVIFCSFVAFIILTGLTVFARSAAAMFWLRLFTGVLSSGVVPVALALTGDIFPYNERGRALGWLFGAMAGGMAFGSTVGAVLEPFISWQGLFISVSILSIVILLALLPYGSMLNTSALHKSMTVKSLLESIWGLLRSKRGARTYTYVLLNSIFHSGIFTWLGLYFSRNYGLNEIEIGLALLGYGIPGFLLGPVIGRLADKWGRSYLIPIGLSIGGLSVAALELNLPVIAAALFVTTLSLGYDMTQPLLAGIVTDLSPKHGLAMGFNVFILFIGFGTGSLIFSGVLPFGFKTAFALFSLVILFCAILAVPLFRTETRKRSS